MLHYIIITVLIGIIIYIQFKISFENGIKIKNLFMIFPNVLNLKKVLLWIPKDKVSTMELNHLMDNITIYEDNNTIDSEEIILLSSTHESAIFQRILSSLNVYLLKNKGAASDFHLIKDIVERNCDAAEEDVNTALPMPLYLGLMGTMMGIIIGIGTIALTRGGFSAFVENPKDSIGILMGGIAIAMFSSLCGIGFTFYGSWKAKNAKTETEATKNEFYTWIQTELLPVLSSGTTNSLQVLQGNLSTFNTMFSNNIAKMEIALQGVGANFKDQLEMLKLIDSMDIKQFSKANVQVLKELQNSTKEFERFNYYMNHVNDYLLQVNDLNRNVNEHLNRTAAIENMGQFFQNEVQDIAQRKAAISAMVGTVDDILKNSFNELKENSEKQISEFKQMSIINQEEFTRNALNQEDILKDKLKETSAVIAEMKNLVSVRDNLQKLENSTNIQTKKLDNLLTAFADLSKILITRESGEIHVPKGLKILGFSFIGTGIAASVILIAFIATSFKQPNQDPVLMNELINRTEVPIVADTTKNKL